MTRVEELDIMAIEGASSIAVAGVVAGVWSKSFKMPIKRSMAIEITFASPGTVEVAAWLEVGNVALTAAQEKLTSANYVIPVGDSALVDGAAAQKYIIPMTPTVAKFGRIKFIGTGANDAGTTVTGLKILVAEDN